MTETDRMCRLERWYMQRIEELVREGKPFRACLHRWGFEVQLLPDWKPKLLHERTRRRLIRRGVLLREDIFDGTDLRVVYENYSNYYYERSW